MSRSSKKRPAMSSPPPRKGTPRTPQETDPENENGINYRKIALVFLVYGILNLVTAWAYTGETKSLINESFKPSSENTLLGPLQTTETNSVVTIHVNAKMIKNTWSFVEGEVLDAQKEYLFSFGQEFWRQTGYEYNEGNWDEQDSNFKIDVTFPEAGKYFLNFKTESSKVAPTKVLVKVTAKRGSNIPHLWFGILCLIIAIILNEITSRTIHKTIKAFGDD